MKHIRHIIWDLDGVLYEYHPAHIEACYEAYGLVAEEMIGGMDRATAQVLARQSYDRTRAPVRVFVDEYGMDEQTFLKAFTKTVDISNLKRSSDLRAKLLTAQTSHNILTISDDVWTQRIVKHLGLDDIFTPDRLFTAEKCRTLHKAHSAEPFRLALDGADTEPSAAIMVEDSQKNLKHAKEIGLTTVWVRPKQGEARETYTDYVFDTPELFLDYCIAQRL